ncbi:MAG: glycosyltransferase [Erysipelotrichaceae bacterium]|nr:glycosyltransferase [Erysipelotrichaceae bacterium]
MKKILFVNDEMTMGGVARILNTLLKNIDRTKYEVDLLVLHKRGELLPEVPEGIRVLGGTEFFDTIDLPLSQCRGKDLFHKLRLLFYMKTGLIKGKIAKERKKILQDHYDIEFSAKEGFCTIFTAYGDSDRKLNWVQVDYKQHNYSSHHMELVKEALKHIDQNIACSETVKASYAELFAAERITVIHNLIDEERIRAMSLAEETKPADPEKIDLVCVARFHPQKGLDRLIRAYAEVKDFCDLTVIGDGELHEEIHALAKEKGVEDLITWTGMMGNPYPLIRKADLFVLPSLYEGYPTITIESLVSDTPVLACEVAGVKEQLLQEETGWVIENSEEAFTEALKQLKGKKAVLQEYKKKLLDYHYPNPQIMKELYGEFEGTH